MHRDAIAFGLEEMPGQEDAGGNPDSAMERRPALRALEGKIQLRPWIRLPDRFVHVVAVKAQLRDGEHAVGIDPGVGTTDGTLNFAPPGLGKMRNLVQAQIRVARGIGEPEPWNEVEVPHELRR